MPNSNDIIRPLIRGCASSSRHAFCVQHHSACSSESTACNHIQSCQSSRQHATNVQNASMWPATTMEFACHVTIMTLIACTDTARRLHYRLASLVPPECDQLLSILATTAFIQNMEHILCAIRVAGDLLTVLHTTSSSCPAAS
jgi:hypothetical protein